jgi:hypothetical protein
MQKWNKRLRQAEPWREPAEKATGKKWDDLSYSAQNQWEYIVGHPEWAIPGSPMTGVFVDKSMSTDVQVFQAAIIGTILRFAMPRPSPNVTPGISDAKSIIETARMQAKGKSFGEVYANNRSVLQALKETRKVPGTHVNMKVTPEIFEQNFRKLEKEGSDLLRWSKHMSRAGTYSTVEYRKTILHIAVDVYKSMSINPRGFMPRELAEIVDLTESIDIVNGRILLQKI